MHRARLIPLLLAASACGGELPTAAEPDPSEGTETVAPRARPALDATRVTIRQAPEREVEWVLPAASQEDDATRGVESLLRELPIGGPTRPVTGHFTISVADGRTPEGDSIGTFSMQFTDPEGADYELRAVNVVPSPLPTVDDGGVTLDREVALTGVGDHTYGYASIWFLADLLKDGDLLAQRKLVHVVTTTARDSEEHDHQTEVLVLPVTMRRGEPVRDPLQGGYMPSEAEDPPFIHVRFKEDEIVQGPPFRRPEG